MTDFRVYGVTSEVWAYFGDKDFVSNVKKGKKIGSVVGAILTRLSEDRSLVLSLLEPENHGVSLDESMVFAQQIFFLLGKGAWFEALELAALAQSSCKLERVPFTSACIKFGVAYGCLSATAAMELEALAAGEYEHLAHAVDACERAIRQLDHLSHLPQTSVTMSLKVRIPWALACAHALHARLIVESWLAKKRPDEFANLKGNENAKDFEVLWEKGVGNRAITQMQGGSRSDKQCARDIQAIADHSVDLLVSLHPQSKFLSQYSKQDPDLLYVRYTNPHAKKLKSAFWGYEHHYKDFVKAAASLDKTAGKGRSGTSPPGGAV